MGLLRDGIRGGIGAALGANNANNGLGPRSSIPGLNKPSGPPDQSKNPYSSYASARNSPNPYDGHSPYGGSSTPYVNDPSRRYSPPRDSYRGDYDRGYYGADHKDDRDDRYVPPPLPPRRDVYPEKQDDRSGHQNSSRYESGFPSQPPSYETAVTPARRSPNPRNFRPLALPQVQAGDGQPFMRAYSSEIEAYGISEKAFIHFLDDLNVAVRPNPEIAIFQKAANIAGWFIPGAGSLGLVGGQIVVGIGGAIGKKTAVSKCLANANLALFLPAGLEVVTCTVKDVNHAAGVDPSLGGQMYGGYPQNGYENSYNQPGYGQQAVFGPNPMMGQGPYGLIQAYGNALAPVDVQTRMPLVNAGRQDPVAMLANGMANRDKAKSDRKAAKKAAKGGGQQNPAPGSSGTDVKWLLVRLASPESTQAWQNTLSAAQQEEHNAEQEGRQPM